MTEDAASAIVHEISALRHAIMGFMAALLIDAGRMYAADDEVERAMELAQRLMQRMTWQVSREG